MTQQIVIAVLAGYLSFFVVGYLVILILSAFFTTKTLKTEQHNDSRTKGSKSGCTKKQKKRGVQT